MFFILNIFYNYFLKNFMSKEADLSMSFDSDKVSCSPGWPKTLSTLDHFQFLIFVTLLSGLWDYG